MFRARARRVLPPPSPPIEATATEQKNDNYNDKKRGHVHGFSVLSQSLSQGILDPARWALNIAGCIFVATRPAQQRRACLVPREETRPEAVKLVPPPYKESWAADFCRCR